MGILLMAGVTVFSFVRAGQKMWGGGMVSRAAPASITATNAVIGADGIQRVTLGFGRLNYNPAAIRVRRGIPVALTADRTVGGCFSSFVIPELNVWKQFSETDRTITFTPNRSGTFRFTCAMGMGDGRLIVEES